jgi:outer membrane receptor protein involved in Fe transport
MRQMIRWVLTSTLMMLCATSLVFSQTTGKISGKVVDAETGEALPGANIQLEGTPKGAATSMDGSYYIINIPPGSYSLRVQYMGYNPIVMDNVRVSINRTTAADFKMTPVVLEGKTVVIEAEKMAMKKDQTSSIRNVTSQQIEILPVESVGQVVNLQAGVVNGHFRGGRFNEVTYLIDGMQVTEQFSNSGRSVEVESDAVEEVEVIKGTFNAEYGRAMSGIVNAVTKDGGSSYHGSLSGSLGNYFTPNKDIFIGLKDNDVMRRQDFKFQLSGPIFSDKLTFFANLRYQDNKDQFNGYRIFKPTDVSFFNSANQSQWFSQKSGDSTYVPMSWGRGTGFDGKLTSKISDNIKLSLLYILNDWTSQGYSHFYKYNPDGRATGHNTSNMFALNFNHMISSSIFYEAKMSYLDGYTGWYKFKSPNDPGYIPDWFDSDGTGPGFSWGGMERGHTVRTTKDLNAKLDLTWQIHKNHSIKTGVDYLSTEINQEWGNIRNYYASSDREFSMYKPVLMPDSSVYSDIYDKKPYEFAAYLQDKMEFDEMTINFGVRYDYFNPRTTYPSNRRNPVNLIDMGPLYSSTLLDAEPKSQLSPRLGLSYQLGKTALLHFSYGHFFQRPPYENFYQNNDRIVAPQNFSTQQGNPQLKAQKTVQYEIGLWQQLMQGMGLEVSLFYRDIYELLSMAVITTYNDEIYGLYTNLDYGNAKGLEVTYDLEWQNIYTNVNYTLQYTRGNADNPTTTFDRAGQSMDPIPRLIPMSWDQRHTLNASVAYRTPKYGASFIAYFNSGRPYTLAPLPETHLARVSLYPNNSWAPSRYSVDLYGFYNVPLAGKMRLKFEMYVYNVLDRLNEEWVNGRTGRAYTNIVLASERENHRSDFNTVEDTFQNPSAYSAPRLVKFIVGLEF